MLQTGPSSSLGLTDEEAMCRLARGEIAPLGEVYRRHAGAVSTLLWRLLPGLHRQDIEDLTQEVFLTLFKTAGRYQEEGKLRGWLYGIALRKARSHRRRHFFRRQRLADVVAARTGDQGEQPSELRLDLERHMRTMSHTQREALVLYVLEGLSGEEIAATLGVPLNTVWTRLRRARTSLVSVVEGDALPEVRP